MFCLLTLYVLIKMRSLRKRKRSPTDMSRDSTHHLLLHSFACNEILFRLRIFSILPWYFLKDLKTKGIDLLRCTNECFNARFCAMDFSNASSNARARWVRRCPYFVTVFVLWITFYTLLLCASKLYVISGFNLLFYSTSSSPWLSSGRVLQVSSRRKSRHLKI